MNDCKNCKKILVLDDDYFNKVAFNMLLQCIDNKVLGNSCDEGSDGIEGLNIMEWKMTKCCGKPYKFVFVDYNMP